MLPLPSQMPAKSFRLEEGRRVAVWFGIHIEHWSLLPPPGSFMVKGIQGNWPDHFPDYRSYSFHEYGNRVGIVRLFDLFDNLALPFSLIINAEAIGRYPEIVTEAGRRGADFVVHGRFANRMITGAMTEAEEREEIAAALATYRVAFGRAAEGWMGPEGGESARTLQLLAEAGLRFVLDWPSDDVPGVFATDPPLVSIPNQWEYDDLDLMWTRNVRPWNYERVVAAAFEGLAAQRRGPARLLGLHIHPWLLGQPARIPHLRAALARLKERDDAAFLTVGAIAALARQELAAPPAPGDDGNDR